jgi:hypothetical protein
MQQPNKRVITIGGKYGPFDIQPSADGEHWQVIRRATGEIVDDDLTSLTAAFQLAQNAQAMEWLFGVEAA